VSKPSLRPRRRQRHQAPPALPSRQRGAAAVFAAVAIVAMITSMLLGINIGMLYYAQRDLQKMAVMGALAGVQISSGCRNSGVPGTTAAAKTRVLSAMQANTTDTAYASYLTGIDGAAAVQVGHVNDSSGTHTFVALADGNAQIDAVRVNLSRTSPSLFGAGFFPGSAPITLKASATARQQPLGAFSIGSTLLTLNTSESLLNPLLGGLLGTSLSLSAVSYNGLAQTKLSLANLMVAANVTDLSSLLSVSTNANALKAILASASGQVSSGTASLITGITLGTVQAGTTVSLGDILGGIGTGLNPTVTDIAAQVPFLNALDLLAALGYDATYRSGGVVPITLPVSLTIPGLTSVYVFLQVLSPMQPSGFGPVGTTQTTSQVVLKLRANVDTSGVLGLLSALAQATINLGLDVNVANATGTIQSLVCPSASSTNPSATVAVNTSVVKLTLGGFNGNPQSDPVIGPAGSDPPLLNVTLLGIPIVTLGVKTPVTASLITGNGTAGAFTNYTTPQLIANTTHNYLYNACNSLSTNPCTTTDSTNPQTPVSSTDIATGISNLVGSLVNHGNLSIDVLGIGLGSLLDPIISALNTAILAPVTSLVSSLLNPLLAALGVQVGSGTVLWQAFETGQPVIVTTALP
jgi:uncharacterized membrane protein